MAPKSKDIAPRHDPWDIPLEQAVLGAMLVDNRLIDAASAALEPEDFYDPLHQRIFEMMVYLLTEGTVTPPIVYAVMKTDPGLAEMGGVKYLAELAILAPSLPPIKEYCRIIKDLSSRRNIIALAEGLLADATLPPREAPTANLAEKASDGLDAILAGTRAGAARRSVKATDALGDMLRRIEAQAVAEKPHGVGTGIEPLDDIIGGLFPGKLIILAGRPGMGKSIFGTNIAKNVAARLLESGATFGIPVGYLSGEMDNDELSARVGTDIDFDRCAQDGLKPAAYGDFAQMRATGEMVGRLAEANLKLHGMDLEFFDTNLTLEWIEATCRRRSREKPGHRLVIIDHLQLVTVAELRRGANRNDEQTIITKRLKGLARELGITILALSQLSREVEKREDKHPILADLREGGSIEQDADIVIGIMRPILYARARIQAAKNEEQRSKAIVDYDDAKGVLEAAVLKQRGGRTTNYFRLYIDEKASAIRATPPAIPGREGDLIDWAKLAEDMRG